MEEINLDLDKIDHKSMDVSLNNSSSDLPSINIQKSPSTPSFFSGASSPPPSSDSTIGMDLLINKKKQSGSGDTSTKSFINNTSNSQSSSIETGLGLNSKKTEPLDLDLGIKNIDIGGSSAPTTSFSTPPSTQKSNTVGEEIDLEKLLSEDDTDFLGGGSSSKVNLGLP